MTDGDRKILCRAGRVLSAHSSSVDVVSIQVTPDQHGLCVAQLFGRDADAASTGSWGYQQTFTFSRSGSAHTQLYGSASQVFVRPNEVDAEFVTGLIVSASHDALHLQGSGSLIDPIDWIGNVSLLIVEEAT